MFSKLFYGQAMAVGTYGTCISTTNDMLIISVVVLGLSSFKLLQIGYSDGLKMDKTSNYKKKLMVIGHE